LIFTAAVGELASFSLYNSPAIMWLENFRLYLWDDPKTDLIMAQHLLKHSAWIVPA
jgi:hypothetical protein